MHILARRFAGFSGWPMAANFPRFAACPPDDRRRTSHSASNLRRCTKKQGPLLERPLFVGGRKITLPLCFPGAFPHTYCHNRPQQGNARQSEQSIGGCRTGGKSTDGYGGGACRERGIHGTVKFGSACQVNGFKPVIVDGWCTDGTVYPFIRRSSAAGGLAWNLFTIQAGTLAGGRGGTIEVEPDIIRFAVALPCDEDN